MSFSLNCSLENFVLPTIETLRNLGPRSLVDHERQGEPVLLLVELQLAADGGLEEPQTAIVGDQAFNVLVDLFAIHLAFEEVEDRRARLDDRGPESCRADDLVADEVDPEDPLFRALVDEVEGAEVARLVAFEDGDADLAVAVLVVELLDAAAALLDGERIGRVAHLQLRLFLSGFVRMMSLPMIFTSWKVGRSMIWKMTNRPPGTGFESGFTVTNRRVLLSLRNVLLDGLKIEGPARSRADVRQDLLQRDGPVALDADLDDHFLGGPRGNRAGVLAEHRLLADRGGRRRWRRTRRSGRHHRRAGWNQGRAGVLSHRGRAGQDRQRPSRRGLRDGRRLAPGAVWPSRHFPQRWDQHWKSYEECLEIPKPRQPGKANWLRIRKNRQAAQGRWRRTVNWTLARQRFKVPSPSGRGLGWSDANPIISANWAC